MMKRKQHNTVREQIGDQNMWGGQAHPATQRAPGSGTVEIPRPNQARACPVLLACGHVSLPTKLCASLPSPAHSLATSQVWGANTAIGTVGPPGWTRGEIHGCPANSDISQPLLCLGASGTKLWLMGRGHSEKYGVPIKGGSVCFHSLCDGPDLSSLLR